VSERFLQQKIEDHKWCNGLAFVVIRPELTGRTFFVTLLYLMKPTGGFTIIFSIKKILAMLKPFQSKMSINL
jgi:hypothetical protein